MNQLICQLLFHQENTAKSWIFPWFFLEELDRQAGHTQLRMHLREASTAPT